MARLKAEVFSLRGCLESALAYNSSIDPQQNQRKNQPESRELRCDPAALLTL